jgi:hypothetical protein
MASERFLSAFAAPQFSSAWPNLDDRWLIAHQGYRFDNYSKKSYDLFEKRGYPHVFVPSVRI